MIWLASLFVRHRMNALVVANSPAALSISQSDRLRSVNQNAVQNGFNSSLPSEKER